MALPLLYPAWRARFDLPFRRTATNEAAPQLLALIARSSRLDSSVVVGERATATLLCRPAGDRDGRPARSRVLSFSLLR